MRKDVKFGMALSLVAVVVAGWYFTRSDSQEKSIPLTSDTVSDPQGATLPSDLSLDAPEALPESSRDVAGRDVAGGEEPAVERRVASRAVSTTVAEPLRGGAGFRAATGSQPVADSQADATLQNVAVEKISGGASRGVLLAADRSVVDQAADSRPTGGSEAPAFFDLTKALGASRSVQKKPANFGRAESATTETGIRAVPKAAKFSEVTRAARGSDSRFGKVASRDVLADRGDEAVEIYKVQPGDSFAVLAEVYYGSQRYTQFLMDANPKIAHPEDLRVGMLIRIPPLLESSVHSPKHMDVKAKAQSKGKGKPKPGERFYVVKKNDSFYRIAQRELGSGSRWRELFAMNKSLVGGDSNGLRPGMTLRMPK